MRSISQASDGSLLLQALQSCRSWLLSRDQAALRRFEINLHFRPLDRQQRRALFAREAFGDAEDGAGLPELVARHLDALESLTAGDVATVCRQRALLGEKLSAEQFLRRLVLECRLKDSGQTEAA